MKSHKFDRWNTPIFTTGNPPIRFDWLMDNAVHIYFEKTNEGGQSNKYLKKKNQSITYTDMGGNCLCVYIYIYIYEHLIGQALIIRWLFFFFNES